MSKAGNTASRITPHGLQALAAIAVLVLWCSVAAAETGHVVYLPGIFSAEGKPMRTTACLQVLERGYSRANWWEDAGGSDDAAERAFKATLLALKHKDKDALLRLSHPTLGRDPKQFEQQATAYFQQFQVLAIVAVPRAYEFDGLVVFFAKVQFQEKSGFTGFVFAQENDGSYGFLPYRSEALSYTLVNEWAQSDWGLTNAERAVYCTDAEIKRTTHRLSLSAPQGSGANAHTSHLLLAGGAVDMNRPGAGMAASVKQAFDQMNAALAAGKYDEFVKHLTPEGGGRLKEWFTAATEADKAAYSAVIARQRPYFYFDAAPLVIVFTKSATNDIQVLYFTPSARNGLLWTNSSYITDEDKVYKSGPLMKAAAQEKPFSSIEIK